MIISRTGRSLPEGARSALLLFLLPPAILTVWGGIFLNIATSGRLRWFLNPLFWPVEIIAGVVMLCGAGGYFFCFQPVAFFKRPKIPLRVLVQALILILPVVVANALAPPSFSAAALERRAALSGGRIVAQAAGPEKNAAQVKIVDLAAAAYYPEHIPEVSGKQVSYIGQYFPGGQGGFRFCRVLMSCCAQDATPIYLNIMGADPKYREMQWIEVRGETFFRKDEGEWVPCLKLQRVTTSHPPADPYLYPVKTGK